MILLIKKNKIKMGCSSCCAVPPEIEDVPSQRMTTREARTNTYTNTKTKTKPETKDNKSDDESAVLSEDEVNEMMGELQLFLNFLQTRAVRKETIGQGGQGKIVKYYSDKYHREVVEKIVNLNNCTRGTLGVSGIKNLIKEAILLSGFDHPNIVKIFDFKPNPPTIIMEYCAKGSLRQILDKPINLPLKYKIFLIRSICSGLSYVHSKGIVHGDLKCDNILLSDEKRVKIDNLLFPIPKLADFGLGQFGDNKIVGGTPGFIAPEILKGSGLTFKTDIFALGMLMFEILSGLRPIPAQKEYILNYLAQRKIPCTKEVLRKAYELKEESLLPGIKNPIYEQFYAIMIECIKDDPTERPNIEQVFEIVKLLESALLILIAIL
jgi:serine/threonine protein kinase